MLFLRLVLIAPKILAYSSEYISSFPNALMGDLIEYYLNSKRFPIKIFGNDEGLYANIVGVIF
jgi:hypothetical protein